MSHPGHYFKEVSGVKKVVFGLTAVLALAGATQPAHVFRGTMEVFVSSGFVLTAAIAGVFVHAR